MKRSTDRILTTHVGSLPRPPELSQLVQARAAGKIPDDDAYAERVRSGVGDIVRKQVDLGLDVIADGEVGKTGFLTYVNDRVGGFEIDTDAPKGSPFAKSREFQAFTEAYQWATASVAALTGMTRMVCTGPLSYKGHAQIRRDLDNLKAALKDVKPADVFVPSLSPTSMQDWNRNRFYKSDKEFLYALADVMHEEYKAIVDADFVLQIDDPHIATYYVLYPEKSIADVRIWAEEHVEALNHALRGIPREKVRWHTCYGINMGPRVHDLEVKEIIDIILKVNAGAFSFEAANSRHEHEWRVWADAKRPDGTILIPGVITNSNIMVEHPELIADRIVRYANAVGRENVIAGADCGFASSADTREMHPSVVWAKLEALVKGARIASQQLWGRA